MVIKQVHFSEVNSDALTFSLLNSHGTNSNDIQRMKRILKRAISDELTSLQRLCLLEYYLGGKRMKEISEDLHVHPSTVTRHIKRAKEKLRNISKYYEL